MRTDPPSQKTLYPMEPVHGTPSQEEPSKNKIPKTRLDASGHLQPLISFEPQPAETLQQAVSNYLEQQEEPGPGFCRRMSQEASAADCRRTLMQLTTCCIDRIAPDRAIDLCVAVICRMLNIPAVTETDIQQARYYATEVLFRFGPDAQNRQRMQIGLTSGLPLKPFATHYINGEIEQM